MSNQQNGNKYKRILLKLSGEELLGERNLGIDPKILDNIALEMGQLVGIGVQIGIVVGGGNLFRGSALSAAGMDRRRDSSRVTRGLTSPAWLYALVL